MERANGSVAIAHEKGDAIISLLADITGRLDDLASVIDAQTQRDSYSAISFIGVADATGAIQIAQDVRGGFILELISFAAVAALGGGFLVYLNDLAPTSLLFVDSTSTYFSESFPDGCVVPENSRLIVVFTGVGASTPVSCTIRARNLPLSLSKFLR